MTETASQLLATFETLPVEEQHEVLAQMLRRTGDFPVTFLADDALTDIADQLFQSLDAEEADGERTNAG
ncbi:MAG: hypothetical protein KDA93_17345 [Planctomycetaceae bacterium]|nr:hypothetical protein [Planctomycetaceae bacterium]